MTKKRNKKEKKMDLITRLQRNFKQSRKLAVMAVVGVVGVAMLTVSFALDSNVGPYKELWISKQELFALPTSGAAWDRMVKVANSDIGTPNLADQSSYHGHRLLAVALVAARTQDDALKEKVAQNVAAAIGTENNPDGRTLSLGRQLASYVIAADIINLPEYDPVRAATFADWLKGVRTEYIGNHGRWVDLTQTHENSASNWGAFAGASRLAASLYLGDTADVERAANIFRSLGDRSYYPSGKPWGSYFQPTTALNLDWSCGTASNWIAINTATCSKYGYNLGGAPVEDISRELDKVVVLPQPQDSVGVMYSWGVMKGFTAQAELLHRAGYDAWNWNDQMMRRGVAFIERAGWHRLYTTQTSLAWLVNSRYGTTFPTEPVIGGRPYSWTDWTHAKYLGLDIGQQEPPDADTTPPTVSITSPTDSETLSGVASITTQASDDKSVAKVIFQLDGEPIAVDSTSPYSWELDTSGYGDGSYTISAIAVDSSGNSSSEAKVLVAFKNSTTSSDTNGPALTLLSPIDSAEYTKKADIHVKASDESGVSKISVYVDGKLVASTTGETLQTRYNIGGKNVAAGPHILLIEAVDSKGNKSTKQITFIKK
jgi:hypothetical protein